MQGSIRPCVSGDSDDLGRFSSIPYPGEDQPIVDFIDNCHGFCAGSPWDHNRLEAIWNMNLRLERCVHFRGDQKRGPWGYHTYGRTS
jgi:hypothetical protein